MRGGMRYDSGGPILTGSKAMGIRTFLIYDARAMGATADGTVLDTADSMEEARREIPRTGWNPACVYSYALDGDRLVDEQFEAFVQ